MKIVQFKAENVKRLKAVEITPVGAVVEITGDNGSGKSSILDAIQYALGGTKGLPSQPVRTGQEKAVVRLDLGEIIVTRKFKATGETALVVEAKNGARFPSPQSVLDKLYSNLTFDPLEFSRMAPKAQLETLRGMVKLDVDIDALDGRTKTLYEERTEVNRQLKSLQANIQAMEIPEGTPDGYLDESALAKELQKAGEENAELIRVQQRVEDKKKEVSWRLSRVEQIKSEIQKLNNEWRRLESEVEEIRGVLHALKVPEQINTDELVSKLNAARKTNAEVGKKILKQSLQSDAIKKDGHVSELTSKIQANAKLREDTIAAAKMPVEGLSFGDGEVIYNGLPLSQASSAEQLRVSVAIAMAANPQLRILKIRDGSLLDEKSLKQLTETAELNDYQIWLERVEQTRRVSVVMEDGAVKPKEEVTQ